LPELVSGVEEGDRGTEPLRLRGGARIFDLLLDQQLRRGVEREPSLALTHHAAILRASAYLPRLHRGST
jgi:hypothetical protein